MPGAARLAGEAAYRAGAGLVTVATHPTHAAFLNTARPELIVHGVRNGRGLAPLLAAADAIAVGPGLGRSPWARSVWAAAGRSGRPLVVDADALNLLAGRRAPRADWILSPHPGEAARLLGMTSTAVQDDRFAAVEALVGRYGGVCVLKGSGTLIAGGGDGIELCDRGNPGLASGGSGDVLTGVLAALRAQGLAARDAARLGVWLHAAAGDAAAAQGGEIGLLAADLFGPLRALVNELAG
jgi:NAD(P)H-hydrate epimerase